MKVLIVCCLLIASAYSRSVSRVQPARHSRNHSHSFSPNAYFGRKSPPILYVENELGEVEILDLAAQTVELLATVEDVTYHLYTRENVDHPYDLPTGNANLLLEPGSPFRKERPNLFITHGWENDKDSAVNQLIKNATLNNNNDYNVFVVDWSPVAKRNYLTARNAVEDVGQYLGNFINDIQTLFALTGEQFILVGHSLGAHVTGNAGMTANVNISYLVGLDPASPLFELTGEDGRLDASDADFVEAIHTNGAILGVFYNIGDLDYYPNGGLIQPGCGVDLTGSCSHGRSYEYYAESITSTGFLGRKCDAWRDYRNSRCIENPTAIMGGLQLDERVGGAYYLSTNSEAPYATGSADVLQ